MTASCVGAPQWHADREEAHLPPRRSSPALDGFVQTAAPLACDEWVLTPTVVIQHDDVFNLYHSLADFWRVWLALALLQQPACEPAGDTGAPWGLAPRGVEYADDNGRRGGTACTAGTQRVQGIDPDELQLLVMDGR